MKTERFKRALAHTTRALSGQTSLLVSYGEVAEVGAKNELVLPQISMALDDKKMALARGHANRLAFLERFGGAQYVRALQKHGQPLAAHMISLIESAQTDVLGKQAYAGAMKPLSALNEADAAHFKNMGDVSAGKAYALSLALRERAGESLSPLQRTVKKDLFSHLEKDLKNWLKTAPTALSSPKEKWRAYVTLLKLLGVELPPNFIEQVLPEESQGELADEGLPEESQAETTASSDGAEESELTSATGEDGQGTEEAQMDTGATGEQAGPPPTTTGSAIVDYGVYTTEFDKVVSAQRLVSQGEWSTLQDKFILLTRSNRGLARRLATQLRDFLLAQQSLGWDTDQEEGLIDSTRLAPFVAGGDERMYKQLVIKRKLDTAVTLLVDNSGSMRGRPIDMAAVCTDTLATTLEQCGVVTEVLGFTTAAWKGGKARKKWLEEGRPENPGRLNELLFTVFKPFSKNMTQARRNFPVMLADDVLKENIDGESLQWACGRLMKRRENRKIMIVISDGAPVDYATDRHNKAGYLDRHLRQVIHKIEGGRQVELLAIGIGHDVKRYYKNAVTIQNPDQLGEVMVEKIVRLFKG